MWINFNLPKQKASACCWNVTFNARFITVCSQRMTRWPHVNACEIELSVSSSSSCRCRDQTLLLFIYISATQMKNCMFLWTPPLLFFHFPPTTTMQNILTSETGVEVLSPVSIFITFPSMVHLHFLDLGRHEVHSDLSKRAWRWV